MKTRSVVIITAFICGLFAAVLLNIQFIKYCGVNAGAVSGVIVALVFATWNVYAFCNIQKFKNNIYLWKKMMGMKEYHIFQYWIQKTWGAFLLLFVVLCTFRSSSGIVNKMVDSVNVTLCCLCVMVLLWVSRYRNALPGKIYLLGLISWNAMFVEAIIEGIVKCNTAFEIVVYVAESMPVAILSYAFGKGNVIVAVCALLILAGTISSLNHYDDMVMEETAGKTVRMKGGICNNFLFKNSFAGRELLLVFSSPKYVLYIAVLYVADFVLAINIGDKETAFVIVTVLLNMIAGGCIDFIFHMDADNRLWYKLWGERYTSFVRKKLMVEYLIQAPVIVGFLCCAICCHYRWISVLCVMGYFALYGMGWIMYFSSYYLTMKKEYMHFEVAKMFAAMLVIMNPVTNFIMIFYWYLLGKRRWDQYVNGSKPE